MSDITVYVSLLSDAERNEFVEYLTFRTKRNDTKNVQLFRDFCKGKEKRLKSEMTPNAYNVLASRLRDRIIDFMSGSTMDREATLEIRIIKFLLIARKLFTHGHPKQGFKLLLKAEELAKSINHYSLLNEIYHTSIEQSHHESAPDQDYIFSQFEENQVRFLQSERLNMAYSIIRKAFRAKEYGAFEIDLDGLVTETFEKLGVAEEVGYSFQSLSQLAQIADISGAYRRDYHSIDLFFVEHLAELQGGPMDVEKSLVYHIELIYVIANIYFRKKAFRKSLEFLDQMADQMERYHRKLFSEHIVKLTSLKSLNLSYLGMLNEADEELNELLSSKAYPAEQLLNPRLVRAMIYILSGKFKSAQAILTKFQHNDTWYERHIGLEWLLQKKHMEILLHIELGNSDYVESRIVSLQRKYKHILDTSKDARVIDFLKLVKMYFQNPEIATTEAFKERVEKSLDWKTAEEEDVIFMTFYAWLKAKMEERDTYEVLLELTSS